MTKILFFILTFLSFISSYAFAADCSGISVKPNIKLSASYGKLTYNHEKTASEITSLAQSLNISETGIFASGLSTVNINFDIELNTIGQPIGNSLFCVVPTNINIFLGLNNPTIYLAQELKENSCEYNMVLRHEQTHQQINQTTLEYYLPLFRQAAEAIASQLKPILISNLDDIKPSIKQLTETYNQKLTPLVDYIKKEMLTEQFKLDNPQNYIFESNLCQPN